MGTFLFGAYTLFAEFSPELEPTLTLHWSELHSRDKGCPMIEFYSCHDMDKGIEVGIDFENYSVVENIIRLGTKEPWFCLVLRTTEEAQLWGKACRANRKWHSAQKEN